MEKIKLINCIFAKITLKNISMNNKYENPSKEFKLKSFKIIIGQK